MRTLCVDLASKFSAWQVRDGSEVLAEGDSRDLSAFALAKKIRQVADEFRPDVVLIEDVPPMVKFGLQPIFRLQGVIMLACHPWLDVTLFINPQAWQKHFPGVGSIPRGIEVPKSQRDAWRAARAAEHALRLGYTPPDLVAEYVATLPAGAKVLKKHTNPLEKNVTDYVDAALMSIWAQGVGSITELRKITGIQPAFI